MPDTDIMAKAKNTHELIDYQEGSVVSRVILKRGPNNVTLFAFDKGESLSEHSAPFDVLVTVVDGRADITISGVTVPTGVGQSLIMPADEPHALFAPERFKMVLVMLKSQP